MGVGLGMGAATGSDGSSAESGRGLLSRTVDSIAPSARRVMSWSPGWTSAGVRTARPSGRRVTE